MVFNPTALKEFGLKFIFVILYIILENNFNSPLPKVFSVGITIHFFEFDKSFFMKNLLRKMFRESLHASFPAKFFLFSNAYFLYDQCVIRFDILEVNFNVS